MYKPESKFIFELILPMNSNSKYNSSAHTEIPLDHSSTPHKY